MDCVLFTLRCCIFSLCLVSIFAGECTDSKVTIATANGGHKTYLCPDFVAEKGGATCANDFIKSACCVSCTALETGDSACPYGDAILNFKNKAPMTCTDYLKVLGNAAACEYVKDICCGTCKKLMTGNDKCPYGDGMLNFAGQAPQTCSEYLAKRGKRRCEHRNIAEICCQSCTKALNGVAPESDCPYGDGMINFRGQPPKNCTDYLAEKGARMCSNPSIKSICCKSCAEAFTGKDDCPYGDIKSLMVNGKPMFCEEYITRGSGCQSKTIKERCCATCAKYATGDDNCPYGDSMLRFSGKPPMNCSTYLSQEGARYCSQEYFSKKCCQTCPNLATGKADCPYGNVKRMKVNGKDMTCEEYLPLSAGCSNAGVRDACCETCAAKHTGVAGCLYGEAEYLNLGSYGKMTCPEFLKKFGHTQCEQTWVKQKCCESCA